MTNNEWIELFFSKSYENQINDLILEDWDYEIPRNSLLNYIHNIIDIPYSEFLEYKGQEFFNEKVSRRGIPMVDILSNKEQIIKIFLDENNRGLLPDDLLLYKEHSLILENSSNKEDIFQILHAGEALGVVYCYFKSWYLNCLCYVFDELTPTQKNSLFARLLLRNPFFYWIFSSKQKRYLIEYYDEIGVTPTRKQYDAVCKCFTLCKEQAIAGGFPISISDIRIYLVKAKDRFNIQKLIKPNYSDALKKYIVSVGESYLVSDHEMASLATKAQNGDLKAYKTLMSACQLIILQLADYIVNKNNTVDIEDIIQEGFLGLDIAIEKYSSKIEFSFIAYAKTRVLNQMYNSSRVLPYLVKLPLTAYYTLRKAQHLEELYYQQNQQPASLSELGITENYLPDDALIIDDLSADLGTTTKTFCEDDIKFDSTQMSSDHGLMQESLRDRLNAMLHRVLFDRERKILCQCFGLDGQQEIGLEEIGLKHGLTRERVRQIKEKAIKKIRDVMATRQTNMSFIEVHKCETKESYSYEPGKYIIKEKSASISNTSIYNDYLNEIYVTFAKEKEEKENVLHKGPKVLPNEFIDVFRLSDITVRKNAKCYQICSSTGRVLYSTTEVIGINNGNLYRIQRTKHALDIKRINEYSNGLYRANENILYVDNTTPLYKCFHRYNDDSSIFSRLELVFVDGIIQSIVYHDTRYEINKELQEIQKQKVNENINKEVSQNSNVSKGLKVRELRIINGESYSRIIDKNKKVVYRAFGQFIKKSNRIYKVNITHSAFVLTLMVIKDNRIVLGNKCVHAKKNSVLHNLVYKNRNVLSKTTQIWTNDLAKTFVKIDNIIFDEDGNDINEKEGIKSTSKLSKVTSSITESTTKKHPKILMTSASFLNNSCKIVITESGYFLICKKQWYELRALDSAWDPQKGSIKIKQYTQGHTIYKAYHIVGSSILSIATFTMSNKSKKTINVILESGKVFDVEL